MNRILHGSMISDLAHSCNRGDALSWSSGPVGAEGGWAAGLAADRRDRVQVSELDSVVAAADGDRNASGIHSPRLVLQQISRSVPAGTPCGRENPAHITLASK